MKKVVHINLFRPDKTLFAYAKKEKTQCQIVECDNSDNCELLKRGECACSEYWGYCPYGTLNDGCCFID